jgi:hypothetical protein
METKMEGITTNPYKIIDATSNMGSDANVVEDTDASNGLVAEVMGPNKIIFDSDYFPESELVGPLHLNMRWFSSYNGGTGLLLEYWKKDSDGVETLSLTKDIAWHSDISPAFGNGATGVYFDVNNSYRFVIKSHSTVAESTTISIDWVKLTIEDYWVNTAAIVYASTGAPSRRKFDGGTISMIVSGNPAKTTYVVNVVGWDPSSYDSFITATVNGNENYIASVTTTTSSSFTLTVKHRNDVSATDTMLVCWTAQILEFYTLI